MLNLCTESGTRDSVQKEAVHIVAFLWPDTQADTIYNGKPTSYLEWYNLGLPQSQPIPV